LREKKDDGIVVVLRREGDAMTHTKARTTGQRKPPLSLWDRGINLDVPGPALVAQAAERIAWHERNAAMMRAELERLPVKVPGEDSLAEEWKRDARRRDLTRLMLGHEEHARFLTFVKRHLRPRRTYHVSLNDMAALEIMPKGSYL
jgi:hypothetical protein